MMRPHILVAAHLAVAMIVASATASAVPVTWNLQDVVFADGGVANGSFVFDVDTGVVSEVSIFVGDGNQSAFAPVTYNAENLTSASLAQFVDGSDVFLFSADVGAVRPRQLRLEVSVLPTNSGGTISLVVGPGNDSLECFNCAPFRLVSAGSITTLPVPVLWTLENVLFDDAGVATGSFELEPDGTISSVSITVTGGNEQSFPPVTYDDNNIIQANLALFDGVRPVVFIRADTGAIGERHLRLELSESPSGALGAIAMRVDSGSGGVECFNCSPFRFVFDGWITRVPGLRPIILDQFQLDGSEQNQAIHSSRSVGQSFTVGRNGLMHSIELSLFGMPSGDLTVEILDMTGGDPALAPVLGSITVSPGDLGPAPSLLEESAVTATRLDLSELGVEVAVGDELAFRLTTAIDLPETYAIRAAPFSAPYPDGDFFVNNTFSVADVAFKTFVLLPEPGARLQQIAACCAIVVLARRRNRKIAG